MYDEKLMVVHPLLPEGGLRRPKMQEHDRINGSRRVSGGEHE
jgi:hypothetical protein